MLALLTALVAASGTPPGPVTNAADDDPIICTKENVGSEVGTHMRPKKVCMKKSERDFIERSQRQTVQDLVNDGNDRMKATVQGR